ncbi:phosphotransferase enzyme family protein [Diplodia corticola]|uniref:Phosphotransferase enzyme family protein n=1 Tax=Diplodia corticola TaxID=236234 RepID=A0A1J9QJG1_9PEZI|nr:phosphotransferase enzyme family protein [Diplodia corticola]OJD28616.1 phosphotransferase enzyme family protein [Diplodia corticola]
MNELARVAARATGASRCMDVEKTSDMTYQKVYNLTMNNGREVIARVLIPHMPAPKVLVWNSRVEGNPLGADLCAQLVGYQNDLLSKPFTHTGPLYYADDHAILTAIGPLVYTDDSRAKI